ncbi:serine/threonine protein kinase [Paenibacillus odorifer]|jgi:serine/threonine protein kinase|uniref:Stk1 family PASTA domain-containing Ser/Thr kinase n=1 Tax=Paenibacillus TaxID=44249 RepID=UPI00096BE92B|nr:MULTISPECIES: Stk1 family PASTA domain-containing Ser/Thr kinase [Paenibacillus]MDH6426841.1 serine/threonine protein kinase [Paenibacillus sp. PastH-4]MDH6442867.1 serine/threonine protein kinase [Paenibacillus sp. PastF-4]MDH6526423.1 serine/threonine protein kinase [Paenibacillus sp. PastH-3]OMD66941.1 serine/threonine protein kinase [Paenibacillus odorifer]OMD75364.1 serine/threonine protein kinase [Paenibacillus odorifer]
MIGHELGGRYQVIERIGGGGMALVYRAHDILLNRNVAIKVLRNQFVHDEEFIRRFRREAQSAASLSHPNVVSIYDVGQEDEIHYIVMEYIEGQNLNEIIKERAPLQVDESVRIASQICDALDHAHQNQIIHRDIKPHNILIGRNGRVKVTDFGIARAVTSTTITQTGSVVGSVHYFSPEHAKGVSTGEKSDLYSLGIVLYQMLTGSLPFLGESPISVALKHLQEEFEEPKLLNPLIPQSVENVILRSMRKNPEERYDSAKEMLQDLETCLLPERRSEAKILFNDEEDEDRTRVIPAIKPIQRSNGNRNHREERMVRDEDDEPVPSSKGKKQWAKPTLWIGLTLLLLLAMASLVWYVKSQLVVPEVSVPYVVGKQIEQAQTELEDLGLEVADPILYDYSPNFEENVVIKQSREKDAKVKKGASLILTVNTAKPLPKMPDVVNKSFDDAVKALMALGVAQDRIDNKPLYDENTDEGLIVKSDPALNAEFDPETVQITLYVSKGEESVLLPDLIGKTESEAKALLEGAKLVLGEVKKESSFSIEEGKVTKTWAFDKGTGTSVPPGTAITIYLSTGYPPEALNYTFNVPVAPAQDGKKSKIRIEFVDARNNGEKQDWGTRTIGKSQVLSVNLVLAPNKDGSVIVTRDGVLLDTYVIPYIDAKNGTVQEPEPPVIATPQPTPTPSAEPTPTIEPTIEPEILPGSGSENDGGNNGAVNQTGFVNNSSINSESTNNGNNKHNNKGKDKSKDKNNN